MKMPTHIVAAGAIVVNEKGDFLLVKTEHGGWVYPGGQIEVGENIIDGLIREVKEESGIDVTVDKLIGVYSNTAIYKWYDGVTDVPTKLMMDFACTPIGGVLTTSEETSDVVTAPAIRTRLEAFFKNEGAITYKEDVTKPEFEIKVERTI